MAKLTTSQCPQGFTGLLCDKEVATCGDSKHICLYGSKCLESDDGKYTCDCSAAKGITKFDKFAGLFCEHKASAFCTVDGNPGAGHSFCVNNGTCKDKKGDGSTHVGCTCPEGYDGTHCQFLASQTEEGIEKLEGGSTSRSKKGLGIFFGVFFGIAAVVAGTVVFWKKGGLRKNLKEIDTGSVATGDASSDMNIAPAANGGDGDLNPMMDVDAEGNELSNVEII